MTSKKEKEGKPPSENIVLQYPKESLVKQLYEGLEEVHKQVSFIPGLLSWASSQIENIVEEVSEKSHPERQCIVDVIRDRMNAMTTLMEDETVCQYPIYKENIKKCRYYLNAILLACSRTAFRPNDTQPYEPTPAQEAGILLEAHSARLPSQHPIHLTQNESLVTKFYEWLDIIYWDPLRIPDFLIWLAGRAEALKREIARLPEACRKAMEHVIVERIEVVMENVETVLFEKHPGLVSEYRKCHDALNDILKHCRCDISEGPIATYAEDSPAKEFLHRLELVYWDPRELRDFRAWLEKTFTLVRKEMAEKPTAHSLFLCKEIEARTGVIRENMRSGAVADLSWDDYQRMQDILRPMTGAFHFHSDERF